MSNQWFTGVSRALKPQNFLRVALGEPIQGPRRTVVVESTNYGVESGWRHGFWKATILGEERATIAFIDSIPSAALSPLSPTFRESLRKRLFSGLKGKP